MSAEREDKSDQAFKDLDLTEGEAGSVKGGRFPIEPAGDAGSSGFSMGSVKWTMRRKKKSSSGGSTAGGRPV